MKTQMGIAARSDSKGLRADDEQGYAGFTLVEVLAALTILSILIGVSYGAVSALTSAYNSADASADRAKEERLFYTEFTRRLEAAIGPGLDPSVNFVGDQTKLSFSSRDFQGPYGRREVSYEFDPMKGELLSRAQAIPGAGGDRPLGRTDLPNLKNVNFSYWDAKRLGWAPSWDSGKEHVLPASVRLEVRAQGEGHARAFIARVPVGEVHDDAQR